MRFAKTPLRYMPQLDGIRAIAVMLVFCSHWLPQNNPLHSFPLGRIGVDIFFVLSGFLITKILLKERFDVDQRVSADRKIYIFYIRRALRIFPIYYLLLIIIFITNMEDARSSLLWYASYMTNFYLFKEQNWINHLSHLWTLAVEEQYYLFWPLIIMFIPRNKLLKVIMFFIILGPVSRAIFYSINPDAYIFSNILTINCIDILSMGALLAYIHSGNFQFTINKSVIYIIAGSMLGVILLSAAGLLHGFISAVFHNTAVAIISVLLIHKASIGFEGGIGKLLETNFLVYIGKISYGLYLYHNFIPKIYHKLFEKTNLQNVSIPFTEGYTFAPFIQNQYLLFPLFIFTALVIATFSWYVIEKPINGLKSRFGYDKKEGSTEAVSTV
jgi:peptidoglycan/LPS O-acetylase OafA/YrhL